MDKIKQPETIELRPLKRSYPVILLSLNVEQRLSHHS